jgi:hypothetical protein
MTDSVPQEVLIRHGMFWYKNPEKVFYGGQENDALVERVAFHNERAKLTQQDDYDRGVRANAFWTEEEALEHYGALGVPAPALAGLPVSATPQSAAGEEEEVELKDLPDDELVDWLMSTGRFDNQPKPTVKEVVDAAEDDPDLAERLLGAEEAATGGSPRQGVIDGLAKIE